MRFTTTLTVFAASALLLTGCANPATTPDPAAVATPSVAAASLVTPEPTPETPAPVTASSPDGTVVLRDEVESIRAAGGHVYITGVNGGVNGVIVTPGAPLPQAVLDDMTAASDQPDGGAVAREMIGIRASANDAGLSAFVLHRAPGAPEDPSTLVKYTVTPIGVDGIKEFWTGLHGGGSGFLTKAEAIAQLKPLMDANPSVPIYDVMP